MTKYYSEIIKNLLKKFGTLHYLLLPRASKYKFFKLFIAEPWIYVYKLVFNTLDNIIFLCVKT